MQQINKPLVHTVTGIDCSTNSIAFCRMVDGAPTNWGEIQLEGSDIYEKIYDARVKTQAIQSKLAADFIVVESAIMVRSPDTAIKLSYVYGSVLGQLLDSNRRVKTVTPIAWQSAIGNKNFSQAEKAQLRVDNPGHIDSWYKTKMRAMRKQRTIDWVHDTYRVAVTSDNVADAFGLAYYVDKELTRHETV